MSDISINIQTKKIRPAEVTAAQSATTYSSASAGALTSINNSNWSGADLEVINGGTGASTAAAARVNLGLEIGVDVAAQSSLASVAYKNVNNNFSASQTFGQDLTVSGNLTVNGTTFTANTETVLIEDNLLVINNGETGSGITAAIAGIEVDRGTATNYQFVFEESTDLFKIGTAGSLQAVATRPDNPTAGHFAKWSAGNSLEFVSESSITAGNATALAGYGITRFMLLDNSPVPTFANGDVPVYQSADGFFGSLTLATVARTNSYNDLDNKPSFTETDTLQSVTNRGATTTQAITVGGLTSNGNGTFTGKVGIGVTSPTEKLDVSGRIKSENQLLEGNAPVTTVDATNGVSGYRINVINQTSGDLYRIQKSGVTQFIVKNDGNVGIGTTSPNYPFHVYHPTYNIIGLLESGDLTCGLDLKDSVATGRITNTSGKLSIQADLNAEGADSNINFRVDNVERMRISSSGNVGIGTTSPSAKLQVYDNRDITSNPEDKGIRLLESHGDWLLSLGVSNVTSTGFAIRDNVTNTYPFVIRETTGRVGIGTTNPGSLLEMAGTNPILSIKDSNGSGSAAAPYMQFKDSDGLRLGYFGYGATSNDHLYIQNDRSSGHILFRTNSTTRWEITEFGTLLGYYNLTTSGTITANGGDSDDWNVAFGWGNHANQGYLKEPNLQNYADKTDVNTWSGGLQTYQSTAPILLQNNTELRFGTLNRSHIFSNGTNTYWDMASGDLIFRDGSTDRFTFDVSLGRLTATSFVGNGSLLTDLTLPNNAAVLDSTNTFTANQILEANLQFLGASRAITGLATLTASGNITTSGGAIKTGAPTGSTARSMKFGDIESQSTFEYTDECLVIAHNGVKKYIPLFGIVPT